MSATFQFLRTAIRILTPFLVAACFVSRVPAQDALPAYAPQPVPFPKGASYVRSDGSIYVAGNDLMRPLLVKLNARFEKSHPGFRFTMDLYGSSLAMGGLTSGKSAFGPMAREATFRNQQAFVSRYGYPVTDIRIGWDNNPSPDQFPGGKRPPGVWVNVANPLPSLTMKEVVSIFTTGSPGGDLTYWNQIHGDEGAVGDEGGDWAQHAIHVYLPALRGMPILSTTRMKWGGYPWTPRAEFMPKADDVMNAVARDPFGIGLVGWWPPDMGWDRQAELGAKVRWLPLATTAGTRPSRGRMGDRAPLAGALHILINRPPGQPLAPWLKEYLLLALSRQGQGIIASLMREDGFIPLTPAAAARQRAKLH